MNRITKLPEERKKEIIETAEVLFTTVGYEETSISDIANKIGIANGLIYHYFDSKLELLEAVVERRFYNIITKVEKTINSNCANAWESINLCLDYTMSITDANRKAKVGKDLFYKLLFRNREIIEGMHKRIFNVIFPAVTKLIKRGNEEKIFNVEDVEQTTIFLIAGVGAIFSRTDLEISRQSIENLVKKVLVMKND